MTEAEPLGGGDPIRAELLAAAARVFARKGFAGTKIQDIVREAGLSTGAVYGRFGSKDELLREAVVAATGSSANPRLPADARVADLIRRGAALSSEPLTDDDAVRLEGYVTARREPEVAATIARARAEWRSAIQPLVDAALADGTVAAGVDPEAVVYFVRTMHLGLLLQRAAGIPAPDVKAWGELISRIVASFGDHNQGGTNQ